MLFIPNCFHCKIGLDPQGWTILQLWHLMVYLKVFTWIINCIYSETITKLQLEKKNWLIFYSQGCVINGTIYAEGSAMDSSSLCEYCYCIKGHQQCVRPQCSLTIPGCTAVYKKHTCCPIRYKCKCIWQDMNVINILYINLDTWVFEIKLFWLASRNVFIKPYIMIFFIFIRNKYSQFNRFIARLHE